MTTTRATALDKLEHMGADNTPDDLNAASSTRPDPNTDTPNTSDTNTALTPPNSPDPRVLALAAILGRAAARDWLKARTVANDNDPSERKHRRPRSNAKTHPRSRSRKTGRS